ncbi:MAG: TIGR02147 family protein [Chitinispirillaceae bacterium]|nr:TIGR02147 family protein [Chitinispirillaceae bacterium]
MSVKPIFEYLDYREYLKDHYETNKARNSFFSFRYISSKAGLDPSFYLKVIQKQIHLSLKSLPRLIGFLNLNKKESDYFTLLVRFNRARHKDEMKLYFEKIIEVRELRANTMDADNYEYFSKWYYVAIRELLNYYRFDGDYKALAAKLNPRISEAKARKAIELLLKLGLVTRNGDGSYALTDQFVTTGESWHSIAIENFQREMLHLAEESIKNVPKKNRETSTVTISVSWKCFMAMKERLREIRKELMEMARMDRDPDGVFQVNFQIFPLTGIDTQRKLNEE